MIRIESSWSGLPQAPNIIVPRQRELTWTPVALRDRAVVHRQEPVVNLNPQPKESGRPVVARHSPRDPYLGFSSY